MLGQSACSRCDETEATLKVINRGICLLLGAASVLGRVIVLTSFLFLLSPFCDLELGPCTSTHCCQSQGWEDCTNNATHQPQLWKLSCCSGDHFQDLPTEADFGGRDKSVRLNSPFERMQSHLLWFTGRLWPLILCFENEVLNSKLTKDPSTHCSNNVLH